MENILAKTHAIVFVCNVTSAQYLAKTLAFYYLCCAASSIQLKYILTKQLTSKLFNFIDLRLTHQIISAIFITIT